MSSLLLALIIAFITYVFQFKQDYKEEDLAVFLIAVVTIVVLIFAYSIICGL